MKEKEEISYAAAHRFQTTSSCKGVNSNSTVLVFTIHRNSGEHISIAVIPIISMSVTSI